MILHDAAKAIIRARDYHAEHGRYDAADFHPGEDQSFDDWAADILETAAAADAAPDMLAALKAIASLGGNLSDDAIENVGGANEGRSRGIMYASARKLALAAIAKAEGAA